MLDPPSVWSTVGSGPGPTVGGSTGSTTGPDIDGEGPRRRLDAQPSGRR